MGEPGKPQDQEAMTAQFTPDRMKVSVAELRSLQSRTEVALGKPWTQSEPTLKALAEEATHSPNLLVRAAYPVMTNAAAKQYAIATLRTMLDAALAHGAQLDEATATTYHDAFEGEPLHLKKADDGSLSLATSHLPAGKDLSLFLGK